jgi:integrase/recombinase XerD
MHITDPLARLDATIAAYLAHSRSLGRGYEQEKWVLRLMRRFLSAKRACDINQYNFDLWRRTFCHLHPNSRHTYERVVHNFCRYRRRSEPNCFLPDPTSFARPIPHALPSLVEPEQIARMLVLASALRPTPASPLRPAVMRLALVLLFTTGIRRGELLRLTLGDIESRTGVLRIRESKFHKSRWVPLSPSAHTELRRYLRIRSGHQLDTRPRAPLLCHRSRNGVCPYGPTGMYGSLHALFDAAGVHNSEGRCPRVHDIRHSFAVRALLRWYEHHDDVQANLPKLALYMGHVSIASTAYYLRWMPAVLAQASRRFEHGFRHLVQAGAS